MLQRRVPILFQEASETAFTCMECMEIMKKPVTCIPCGHSYCEGCLRGGAVSYELRGGEGKSGEKNSGGECCPECKKKVEYYIENQLLENLCARYVFRKQAISSLKNMCEGMSKQIQGGHDK